MTNLTTAPRPRIGAGLPAGRQTRGAPITPHLILADLGTPAAATAAALCASQAVNVGALALLNGTGGGVTIASGVATLDVPRSLVAAWTGTAVLTVRGFDEYGAPITESSPSGTSFTGTKAFRRITSITVSANVTALTAGTGGRIGLPFRVVPGGFLSGVLNPNTADAGTFVAADATAATAVTGDVRGTYAPAGTLNGTNRFSVRYFVDPADDVSLYGVPQFAG